MVIWPTPLPPTVQVVYECPPVQVNQAFLFLAQCCIQMAYPEASQYQGKLTQLIVPTILRRPLTFPKQYCATNQIPTCTTLRYQGGQTSVYPNIITAPDDDPSQLSSRPQISCCFPGASGVQSKNFQKGCSALKFPFT